MQIAANPAKPRSLTELVGPKRVLVTLGFATPLGLLLGIGSETPNRIWIARAAVVGLVAMLAYGVLDRWPPRLPRWLGRWVLQLIGIVAVIPFGAFLAYWLTTGGNPQFAQHPLRFLGVLQLMGLGILFAPWIAVGAMVRQREHFARDQALAFELERSEYERKASDARLRLLQAQVAPHFLFNTLANVQQLVDAGSPQASKVLQSLIAYLRAAVPRLHEQTSTLGQELELARAYLVVMQMRMPDRLQFTLHIDESAAGLQCPPMTLLTLVENAIRHGIDPSEEGGRIDVRVSQRNGRCVVSVSDTGAGLHPTSQGMGTGLSTLRERLQLVFGGDAHLRLIEVQPHGVCSELEFPARPVPA